MLGQIIGINWLSGRVLNTKSMASGHEPSEIVSVELTQESNNPTLQFNGATASGTFGIVEAPSPIQSPNAADNANSLSSPVDVLPLESQIFTGAHSSCEGNCEYSARGRIAASTVSPRLGRMY